LCDGQKIASIHFLYITEEFHNRAKSVDTSAPTVIVLGENYFYIPRNIKIIDMHPTVNFIRNANGNQQPNCQLNYGIDEAFDNFIFFKAISDINQGEGLFLDYGGIDTSGLVSLRNLYKYVRKLDVIPLESDDDEAQLLLENAPPCHATRIMQYLKSEKINKPGYSINLFDESQNTDLLTNILQNSTPTLENIKEVLRDQVLYNVFFMYDAQSSYSRTSSNGLCFFNALYQAIQRFLYPDSFDKAEVVIYFDQIIDALQTFEANFNELCKGNKRSGFKWGNLKNFAYSLFLFPQSKEPSLSFIFSE
jgi:hypothetical protein